MNAALKTIDEALEKLCEAIATNAGITENLQSFGAHVLPIGKTTFLRMLNILRTSIENAPDVPLSKEVLEEIPTLIDQINAVSTTLVPQVGSAQAGYAAPSLVGFLWSISLRLQEAIGWTAISTNEKIPLAVVTKYKQIQKSVNALEDDVSKLSNQKDLSAKVLSSMGEMVKAGNVFVEDLEKLDSGSKIAAANTHEAEASAAKALAQITETNQKSKETTAALNVSVEKALASATQIDATATTIATQAGQINIQSENVSQAEKKVITAAEEGEKAKEKAIGEANKVNEILAQAKTMSEDVTARKGEVDSFTEQIKLLTEHAKQADDRATKYARDAEQLAKKANDAFRIVTTAGLAGAFNRRALVLTWTGVAWVVVLLAALVASSYMSAERTKEMSILLSRGTIDAAVLGVQLVLSILTVGAPIWMAWLATKQIAQTFRLAEDYGYKASIAKGYEGYRDEAIKLDPEFQARLFASALQRLDENPLRFVGDSQPGSPVQDVFEQSWFKKMVEIAPSLKDDMMDFVKGIVRREAPAAAPVSPAKSAIPSPTPAPSKP